MHKFVFRLQAVLNERKINEDLALQQFARAQLELAEVQAHLAALDFEREAIIRNRPIELAAILTRDAMLSRLEEEIDDLTIRKEQRESALETARRVLVEARRERKSIEKLKARQIEEHERMLEREAQNELDEIAGRRRASGGSM